MEPWLQTDSPLRLLARVATNGPSKSCGRFWCATIDFEVSINDVTGDIC